MTYTWVRNPEGGISEQHEYPTCPLATLTEIVVAAQAASHAADNMERNMPGTPPTKYLRSRAAKLLHTVNNWKE